MSKIKKLKSSQLGLFPEHTSPPHVMYRKHYNGIVQKNTFTTLHCSNSDSPGRAGVYKCINCLEKDGYDVTQVMA